MAARSKLVRKTCLFTRNPFYIHELVIQVEKQKAMPLPFAILN